MTERWKPEVGDYFWCISWDWERVHQVKFVGFSEDDFFIKVNCFKTREEAEAAAEKVKALLLSLHTTQDTTQDEQLSDCFKVGEWVAYYEGKGYKYFKIAKIELNRLYCEDGKFCLMCDVGAARLRPYNPEEMKSLVGKVIEYNGVAYLVTMYDSQTNDVLIGNGDLLSETTLKMYYTIDGKPCGKLEHLENGEWVE